MGKIPEDWSAYINPETDADRAEAKRKVREAIEQNKRFPNRMIAVAELVSKMNLSNGKIIREGFDESWAAGYNYDWERSLFMARYGELFGKEAAEDYIGDPHFARIVVSWAQVAPEEAIEWVNELEPGKTWDAAVDNVMFGAGQNDLAYGMKIFKVLEPEQRVQRFNKLFDTFRRGGGVEACADLCTQLLGSEDEQLRSMGSSALRQTFRVYQEGQGEKLEAWLASLQPDALSQLDSNQLPEQFRPVAEPEE